MRYLSFIKICCLLTATIVVTNGKVAFAQTLAAGQCAHYVVMMHDQEYELSRDSVGEACRQATEISTDEVSGACTGTGGIYNPHSCRVDMLANGQPDTGFLSLLGAYYCNVTCHGECHYTVCPTPTPKPTVARTPSGPATPGNEVPELMKPWDSIDPSNLDPAVLQ